MEGHLRVILRVTVASCWIGLGSAKLAAPAVTQFVGAGSMVGLSESAAAVLYWCMAGLELSVGLFVLTLRRWQAAAGMASFLLAGLLGAAWFAFEPLRGKCGCFGDLVNLAPWQKALFILGLLVLSSALLRNSGRARRGAKAG